LEAKPDFSELNNTVRDMRKHFMSFSTRQSQIVKDEKRLQKSNQFRVHRAERLAELRREQVAKDLGEYVVDNRNYIYVRENVKPKTETAIKNEAAEQVNVLADLFVDEKPASEPVRPEVQKLLDKDQLKAMTNMDFYKVVQNKYARRELITELLRDSQNKLFIDTELKDIDYMIENADRDIFHKLMSNEISANQLRQKILERKFGIRYMTFEDAKSLLPA
jgi:hypothetical protein